MRFALLCLVLLSTLSAPESEAATQGCLGVSCHRVPVLQTKLHRPFQDGDCVACHRPVERYSPGSHTLDSFDGVFASRGSCLGCHSEVSDEVSAAVVHPPAAGEGCTVCHAPHYSSHPSLLRGAYSPGTYAVFAIESYALCWNCHDHSLATGKFSQGATGFRLGSRNFHYSHLHKRKGMTCRACHTPHGGPQALLLRSGPPRGASGWIDRMMFQREDGGGTCTGGCHTRVSYRR